jgi:amidophosphoribosyltransferase
LCGIAGIIAENNDVVTEVYDALLAIQHRGQDAAGIVTLDTMFHLKKGLGLVQDIFTSKNVGRLRGRCGLGHVRYPTIGSNTDEDVQPFLLNAPFGITMVHNGNVVNHHSLRKELVESDHRLLGSNSDLEVILNVFADELAKCELDSVGPDEIFQSVRGVFSRVKGAYSVIAIIAGKGLLAFRDPCGIKPLIFATAERKDGREYGFFSESVAPDILGYKNQRNLKPGEAVLVTPDLKVHRKRLADKTHTPCMFEWIYFARPDSIIDDISVYRTRRRLGKELVRIWKKTGLDADVVVPVPDSARSAALAFAQVTGIPYREGFVKNRYIGRTFIMAGQAERKRSVRHKLNAIRLEFKDKKVLIMDDSIVRGNTSRSIVKLARQAGAKKVYFASYSAPLRFPCVYGIDMSTREEFIARDRTEEEIAKAIHADRVVYQDIEGMVRAATAGNRNITSYCLACFNGKYPTGDVTPEYLAAIEADRRRFGG